MKNLILILALIIASLDAFPQLKRQDKFSTFCIIAKDSVEKTWGCAIATNNIGIGQYGVFEIEPEVGIVVSIAYTQPDYPIKGIKMLAKGYSSKRVLDSLVSMDSSPQYRQIVIMDQTGKALCYTGNLIQAFTYAGHVEGQDFMAFGNSFLNDQVLKVMAEAFRKSKGKLYERLGSALMSGQNAGGQASGKMSAALCVKKTGQEGFNEVDIRVDYSLKPFDELKQLIDKRRGIDFLIKARTLTNPDSMLFYLNKSATLMEGWTLMYTEVAREYYKLKRPDLAMHLLRLGLDKDTAYKNCLPWNYFLKGYKPYDLEIGKMDFGIHDWLEAVNSLIEANEFVRAEKTGKEILTKYPNSSYLLMLIGKALDGQRKIEEAKVFYQRAMALDKNNNDALQGLKNK